MGTNPGGGVADKPAQISVKIDAQVYRRVRTLAAWAGESISDYLNRVLDPVTRRDLAKMGREVQGKEASDD